MQGHETKLVKPLAGASADHGTMGQEGDCEQVQLTESILDLLMQMHYEASKLLVIRMHDCLKGCKVRMHKDVTS